MQCMQSARERVNTDARKRHTRSRACFSARNVASSVGVCPLGLMATNKFALATTIGKPKGVDLSVLN